MNDVSVTTLGIIAACLTTGCWLPQVVKSWRARSARDFSGLYLTLLTSGVALWIAYGLLRHDLAVIGANVVTLALLVVMIGIKLRER